MVECQQMNVEGMIKLEKSSFDIIVIIVSGKHFWVLVQWMKLQCGIRYLHGLNVSLHNICINYKAKTETLK